MAVELGSAFISVGMGTNKLGPEITKAFGGLDAVGTKAGKSAGLGFGSSFVEASSKDMSAKTLDGLKANVASLTGKMNGVLRDEADAAGRVRVAQEQLNAVRSSGKASADKLAAAEEKLASAQRKLDGAQENTKASTDKLTAAQKDLEAATNDVATASNPSRFAGLAGVGGKINAGMKAALVPALAVGAGLFAVAKGFGDLAATAEQNLGAVQTVFGAAAGGVAEFASTSASSVGLSASSYNELSAVTGTALKSAGVSVEELAAKNDALITRGADLASVFGGDTATAVSAMGAAFRGEFDSLEQYGLTITAAAVNAELAARGQDKLGGAALDAAKKQATMDLIMQQSANSAGNFAKEADTAAGAQQRSNAAWEDATTKLGEQLLPVMTAVAGKVSELATFVSQNIPLVTGLAIGIGSLVAIIATWAAVQAVLNLVMLASPTTWIILGVIALIAAIVALVMNWGTVVNFLTVVWGGFVNWFKSVMDGFLVWWGGVWAGFTSLIAGVWAPIQAVISAAWTVISTIFSTYMAIIGTIFSAGWDIIKTIVATVLSVIIAIFTGRFGDIGGIVQAGWNKISGHFSSALAAIQGLVAGAWGAISGITSAAWNAITGFIASVWNNIRNGVSSAWAGIVSAVSNGVGNVVSFVSSMPGRIVGALGSLGGLLANAGGQIMSGFLSGLRAGFESVKNFVGGIGDWIAANKGPKAYDLALLVPAGGWIMEGLESGIRSSIPSLERTLGGVSATIAAGVVGANYSPAYTPVMAGVGAGAGVAPVNVYIGNEQLDARMFRVADSNLASADSNSQYMRRGR